MRRLMADQVMQQRKQIKVGSVLKYIDIDSRVCPRVCLGIVCQVKKEENRIIVYWSDTKEKEFYSSDVIYSVAFEVVG
jgi:hypothetical protein